MKPKTFDAIRTEEKEARRRNIVAIAENLLAEKGLSQVTIRNVARRAGLSTGAIYMYFRNKEEIFVHLLLNRMEELGRAFEKTRGASFRDALWNMAQAHRDYYLGFGKYVDVFRYLAARETYQELISPDLLDRLRQVLAGLFGQVETFLAREDVAKRLGGLPPERAVPVLWSIITGIAHVTLNSARAEEGGFDFETVLRDTLTLFFGRDQPGS